MVVWISSLLLYIGTMIYGMYLDTNPTSKTKKIFIIWIYIFLCFGYMTGADWRNYEPIYYDTFVSDKYLNEPASWLLFKYSPHIITDFWLFLGIFKCIHLYVLIKLIKLLTNHWLFAISLLFPYQLCFMLIQNPFRFMMALTFVYIALITFIKYKNPTSPSINKKALLKIIILFFIAATFHNSCIFMFFTLPFILNVEKIYLIRKSVLLFFYLLLVIFTSSIDLINSIKNGMNNLFISYFDIKDYSETYSVDDNSNIFSIGNLLKIVFFIFILLTRDKVVQNNSRNLIIYGFTIIYCFFDRALLLIPTGFRLVIPFTNFYIVYVVLMLYSERKMAKLIVIYSFIMFCKNLWLAYDFIPYSNSIPYILTNHKDYYERHLNNVIECKKRTGNDIILKIDKE